MKWIELTVYTTDGGLEIVCGALSVAGLEQVALEESKERISAFLETKKAQWDYADAFSLAPESGPCVKAYLADIPENNAKLCAAKNSIERLRKLNLNFDMGSLLIRESIIDEEDWANTWKQYYKPIPVGEKLLISPVWESDTLTAEQTAGRNILKIDPGMAFGTGNHSTTQLCLEFLDSKVQPGDRILDLGCGSGILAIAALLLGAQYALCVDIDPLAIEVTKGNLVLNSITSNQCETKSGNILSDENLKKQISDNYDIVVANIVADVIISLKQQAFNYVRQGCLFLCSGIIYERADEVKAELAKVGFLLEAEKHSQQVNKDDTVWVALLFKRI